MEPPVSGGPLVSVVMPFLNAQAYIEEAVESVLAQSYPNWELVREWIDRTVAEPDRDYAWQDAVPQWLERLRLDLGGNYVVRESGRFVLLSCVSERLANLLFAFGEKYARCDRRGIRRSSLDDGSGSISDRGLP